MPEIRGNELSLVFGHYDYFTGRAIRIVLNTEETVANVEAACACLVIALRERIYFVSKHAKKIAFDAKMVWHGHASDLQLKVLDLLSTSEPSKVQRALLDLLERELVKRRQIELPTA